MKTLKFQGHSDDIFEAAGDEYYRDFAALVESSEGALVVRAFYGEGSHNKGVWCIGIEPVDEDKQIPSWPVRFKLSEQGYSTLMELDCPDDTEVSDLGILID